MENPVIKIKQLRTQYPKNNIFYFNNCSEDVARRNLREATKTSQVPREPGNYFIYAPYNSKLKNADNLLELIDGELYVLVNVAKAGIQKSGKINWGQFIFERINNVGVRNVARSIIWIRFMNEFNLRHLLFRWVVTQPSGKVNYDNCFLIEKSFYSIWKEAPQYQPHLNK